MKDRRELLKGLAVGSVWAAPVVSSVVLPVHGATTCGELQVRCPTEEESCDCGFDRDCLAERYCIDLGNLVCQKYMCDEPL